MIGMLLPDIIPLPQSVSTTANSLFGVTLVWVFGHSVLLTTRIKMRNCPAPPFSTILDGVDSIESMDL
jgi:hypothetical protein